FKAQINVLHISAGQTLDEKNLLKNFMDKVNSKIPYFNLSFQLLNGDDIEEKIEEYLEQDSCNLLAMSTHERSLMEKLFGKSVTKKMAYHTKIPLMVFHYKKEHQL